MKLFNFHLTSARGLQSQIAAAVGKTLGNLGAWARGEEIDGGGATMQSALDQSVWVYSCVQSIATKLASIPLRFSRGERGGEEMIEGGPLVDLFAQPHPELDGFTWLETVVSHLELRGQSLIVPLDAAGQPMAVRQISARSLPAMLLPIDPQRARPVIAGGRLVSWHYLDSPVTAPIESQILMRDQVIWLRRPHPNSFFDALAPLTVAMIAAKTDYAAAQLMKGLMENNADTGVIATTDQQPSSEQREAILAALKERKRKAGTADRPLFLWGGTKIEKPSVTNADLQFLENRKFTRQEICAVFGVPEQILGFTEDANRAVSVTIRQAFVENCVLPKCARIEQTLAALARQIEPNAVPWFDSDALPEMKEARRARFAAAQTGFSLGVPIDVLSELFDLGLPALPHDGKAYLPFSLQEVGGEEVRGTAPLPVPPAEEEVENPGAEKILRALKTLTIERHTCKAKPEWERSMAGSVRVKKSKLRRYFFEQQQRVLNAMDQLSAERGVRSAELTTPRAVQDVFDLVAENDRLKKLMTPLLKGDLLFGGGQIFKDLDLADTFDVPPLKAIEFLAKRTNEIEGVNADRFQRITESLQEGLGAGDTHADLVERIKGEYRAATDAQAETIATTETNIAVQSGRQMGMVEAGVERKGWQTSHLEGTRLAHAANESYSEANDGIPIDELWPNGLLHPGDPSGAAGEVINCRCFGFAIVGGKMAAGPVLMYEDWLGARRTAQDAPGNGNVPTIEVRTGGAAATIYGALHKGCGCPGEKDHDEN